ncbi:MBOAT family O-acyltransferase [Membranihabitans marinus]|uniref:MBOAT family O-acyltransferase n=1 Tax=Membranihabitans marinus TaxID=1227546 RepID=UPI001F3D2CEB|nr:MBOAT family O-acyltransferase [Membranihabitans marinus]
MLFNSIDFAIFLPIVFTLYWYLGKNNVRLQNYIVVLASYFFYGSWDWRFLLLILFSTLVDYSVGRRLGIEERPNKRKFLLWISLIVNLGMLGFFKYFNFFQDNFIAAFTFMGRDIQANSLNIILPVGISFYTFQTLSYTIDVYKKRLNPTRDLMAFTAFVSFFPQLVAGPIERASHLLPQFYKDRIFDYSKAVDGMRQILWGLFKKIVIADNAAQLANEIFNNSSDYPGSTLLLGAIFFAFQIYGDFSGYSDIAIGTARLFGIDLRQNFAFPYFSRDIAEFWRRWHISLSSWFKDYLYIPLGGSRNGKWLSIRNIFIIFLVSGFWHGANWTFIVWGGLHALFYLPIFLFKINRKNTDVVASDNIFPTFLELYQMIFTFGLTTLAWIFFRANDLNHGISYFLTIFSSSFFTLPRINYSKMLILPLIAMIIGFIFIEWIGRKDKYAIEKIGLVWKKKYRMAFYYSLFFMLFLFLGKDQEFIYFQF